MAARLLLRRAAAPLLAGSLTMIPTAVAFAEAPPSLPSQPDRTTPSQPSKKPIYDELPPLASTFPSPPWSSSTSEPGSATSTSATSAAEPDVDGEANAAAPPPPARARRAAAHTTRRYRGPTPTDRLAGQVKQVRLLLHGGAVAVEDGVESILSRAFSLERSVSDTVASVAPARESGERIMPGAVYVLVAAMAGSVFARNRNVLVRASAPLVLGMVAAKTFIPVTTRNTGDLVWEWEKKVPGLSETHAGVTESWEKGVNFGKVHAELGKRQLENMVTGARETVEGWVKKGK